jgi:arylsulfatase A-like enzyme
VTKPVGLIDLAPTFASVAGLAAQDWMEGSVLPFDDPDAEARGFERVLTEWDSELFGVDVHLRSIYRDGALCTVYGAGTSHDGSEGELYLMDEDPLQQVNRFDDPSCRGLRDDMVDDLIANQPTPRVPRLDVIAPV